jgi:glycerol 2-dehydrogenase (NADP+)
VPACNQLELHLYNPQHSLLAFLKAKGIVAQAYSPLGSTNSPLLQDETAGAVAKKAGLQPSDVLLGWLVAKDVVTLPKSVTPARIKSNLDGALAAAKWLKEHPEDMQALDGVAAAGKQKRCVMCLGAQRWWKLMPAVRRLIMPPWPLELGFENWTNKVPVAQSS